MKRGAGAKTTIVNKLREDFDVDICRPTIFGNPFKLYCGLHGNRIEVLEKYGHYLENRLRNDPGFRTLVKRLYGKRLGCVCKPKMCHGDVLIEAVEYLNRETE